MMFNFQKLSQSNALIVADQWKYDGIYSFYDMTADLEDYEEFTDESLRNRNDHYQAIVDDKLAGFFCVIPEDSVLEIGLGLRPDFCGKGFGKDFVKQILCFIQTKYHMISWL